MISTNTYRLLACISVIGLLLLTGCRSTSTPEHRQSQPQPAAESLTIQVLTGRVVAVADGDTVTVLDSSNTQHRIRLQGIDAPEAKQAFGARSKKNLSDMVFGREVTVTYKKTDQYGRLVGKITLDGHDINLEQVRAGMAWHYKEYQQEQTPEDREQYARAEDDARAEHRGLWNNPDPIKPGEFRRERRSRQRSAAGAMLPLRTLTGCLRWRRSPAFSRSSFSWLSSQPG